MLSFSIRCCKIFLISWRRIVVKLGETWWPIQEKHSLDTIATKFIWIVWIEFYPVLVLENISILEFQAADRSILLLISPVPEWDSLWRVSTQSGNVLIISGKIHCLYTVWMWVEESTHWSGRKRVPNDKHRVITTVGCDHPTFVFGAGRCCDSVAMTLKQFLRLRDIVIDDSCMCWSVEDFL